MLKIDTKFARKYTAIRYLNGQYKPYNFELVGGIGLISQDSINYLIDIGVLGYDKRPKMKILINGYDKENKKHKAKETDFADMYITARGTLNSRFGYVCSEDVIQYLRTKVLAQTMPYYSKQEREKYVVEFEMKNGKLTEEEVEDIYKQMYA